LQPIIRDISVGIARTRAEYREQSPVREVEQLYLDSIAAAQRFIMRQAESLRTYPATPLLVIPLFALAASLAVPLTLLVVTEALMFGSPLGFAYALAGAELSALFSYMLGHSMGRDLVQRYAGKRLNRISKKLSERGVLTIITLRIVPVAPFAVINLVAGASRIRVRDFALGSLIGLLPSVGAVALFADSVVRSLRHPDGSNLAWLLAVLVIIVAMIFGLRKWLSGKSQNAEDN
jgi:phospholipase D1/2